MSRPSRITRFSRSQSGARLVTVNGQVFVEDAENQLVTINGQVYEQWPDDRVFVPAVDTGDKTANGTPSISDVTASGSVNVTSATKTANGTPSIAAVTTTATITKTAIASGAVTLTQVASTGTADLTHTVTGASNVVPITAAGSVTLTPSISITDVNTTESWDDGDTGLVITGTGFV